MKLNWIPSSSELDPLQFAYRQERSTDDALNSISHLTLKHLEDPKAYARLLFIDFSSAFNSLQAHLLLQKVTQMTVDPLSLSGLTPF